MTPAAKEGLPAVVGELVARLEDVAFRVDPSNSKPITSNLRTFRELTDEVRAIATTLSALTAEAGKGEDLHHSVWSIVRPYIQPAAREKVNESLKLALSTATPAGEWVLVPKVPTAAMLDAGLMGLSHSGVDNACEADARNAYQYMLAARPRGAGESK